MTRLPIGTVTLLFTDIEGSTRLLQELGNDRYVRALEEHRRLLRGAFTSRGGVEVELQGDSFFFAFASATDAVLAAAAGQRALTAQHWPDAPIHVRMGIHTGEPLVSGNLYAGLDVHRAARLMSAGHGGQVLVSESTRALVEHEVPPRLTLRDLGLHRLKDLLAPERVYQLGEGEFPQLKSLNQTNLPTQPTPLIGRDRELAELLELVGSSPLVTLTGAGGSGKTRLALQAAAELVDEFPDGVWFISLAPLTDPALLEPTIAAAIGAREDLGDFLRGKKLLLLLDNLEQLLPEVAPRVASFDVRILATSRERLDLASEQEFEVSTLPTDDAVALFTQRARQLRRSFEPDAHVRAIAQRLDGLPLAMELAASLTNVLTPQQIALRLERALDVLTSGPRDAPERQRTLRTTIEWSYGLLTAGEQQLFAQLAVFAGGFSLEAAEIVAGAKLETVRALIDKSLLRQTGEGRLFMLETIREYALERLDQSAWGDATRCRHADWIRDLALTASEELRGERQVEFLDLLAVEHANIRAALRYAITTEDAQLALTIAGSLGRFWVFRGHDLEGRQWLDAALTLPDSTEGEARWRALYWHGIIVQDFGEPLEALRLAEAAHALALRLDDPEAISGSSHLLVRMLVDQGDLERAEALLDESERHATEAGDERSSAFYAVERARLLLLQHDPVAAATYLERNLTVLRRLGDTQAAAWTQLYLALAEAMRERGLESRSALRGSLAVSVDLGFSYGVAACLQVAARLALQDDDPVLASTLLMRADALDEAIGVARRGVDHELLYKEPWVQVRERVGEAELTRLRDEVPLGDVDEAVAYVSRYLDSS